MDIPIILSIILALVIVKKFFGKRWFAYFLNKLSRSHYKLFGRVKEDLFKPLHSIKPFDKSNKSNGITILEVGVGTGNNLRYFPDGTKLIVVDPNPHFEQYYESNLKKFTNITSETFIVTKGQEMDMVKSNSVDAVVITHVFCSVDDAPGILKQVHRILCPGGKLFIFEHILEFDDSHYIRRILQIILTKIGIWQYLCDNCSLDRNIKPDLLNVGFSDVDVKLMHIPIDGFVFKLVEPHLVGVATK